MIAEMIAARWRTLDKLPREDDTAKLAGPGVDHLHDLDGCAAVRCSATASAIAKASSVGPGDLRENTRP